MGAWKDVKASFYWISIKTNGYQERAKIIDSLVKDHINQIVQKQLDPILLGIKSKKLSSRTFRLITTIPSIINSSIRAYHIFNRKAKKSPKRVASIVQLLEHIRVSW